MFCEQYLLVHGNNEIKYNLVHKRKSSQIK